MITYRDFAVSRNPQQSLPVSNKLPSRPLYSLVVSCRGWYQDESAWRHRIRPRRSAMQSTFDHLVSFELHPRCVADADSLHCYPLSWLPHLSWQLSVCEAKPASVWQQMDHTSGMASVLLPRFHLVAAHSPVSFCSWASIELLRLAGQRTAL
jgi:hypothetical protein